MAHHFAHDKKASREKQEQIVCDFSFFVAARLVIKQCFRALDQFEIMLPSWSLSLSEKDRFGRQVCVSGEITHSQNLIVTDFEVEPPAPYNELDIICTVQSYPLGFHFSYSGRPACSPPEQFTLSIVNIDLGPLKRQYQTKLMEGKQSFKQIVMDYVLKGEEEYKWWVSHARRATREMQLNQQLKAELDKANRNSPSTNLISKDSYQICIKCKRNKAEYVENLICTTCLEHYYSKGVFRIAEIKKVLAIERLL